MPEWLGEQNHECPGCYGEHKGTVKHKRLSGSVGRAVGLSGKSARPHAQKTEKPVEHVEHGAPYGNGTYINGSADVACDGHIDESEYRRCQI